MMWRRDGRVVQNMYYPAQDGPFGEDFDWSLGGQRFFQPGAWHTVQTRVVMNAPDQADGFVQSWFDGELALERRGLSLRSVDEFAIDTLYFSTFFGGSAADWAPVRDEFVDFDDFVISTEPITF